MLFSHLGSNEQSVSVTQGKTQKSLKLNQLGHLTSLSPHTESNIWWQVGEWWEEILSHLLHFWFNWVLFVSLLLSLTLQYSAWDFLPSPKFSCSTTQKIVLILELGFFRSVHVTLWSFSIIIRLSSQRLFISLRFFSPNLNFLSDAVHDDTTSQKSVRKEL